MRLYALNRCLMVCWGLTCLIGCAGAPTTSAPFPVTSQKHLQASQHWMLVAEDLAEQMTENMSQQKLIGKPIYLNLQTSLTPFTRAFNDFLITHLVNKGVPVSQEKTHSVVYNYKIQTLQYQTSRSTLISDKVKWTALTGGVYVMRNAAEILNINPYTITAATILDANSANSAPNLELIITSSLLNKNIYVARTTDIYYVNDADANLYRVNGRSGGQSNAFDEPFFKAN